MVGCMCRLHLGVRVNRSWFDAAWIFIKGFLHFFICRLLLIVGEFGSHYWRCFFLCWVKKYDSVIKNDSVGCLPFGPAFEPRKCSLERSSIEASYGLIFGPGLHHKSNTSLTILSLKGWGGYNRSSIQLPINECLLYPSQTCCTNAMSDKIINWIISYQFDLSQTLKSIIYLLL